MCNTYRRLAMAADDDDTERYDIYIYVYIDIYEMMEQNIISSNASTKTPMRTPNNDIDGTLYVMRCVSVLCKRKRMVIAAMNPLQKQLRS